MKLSRLFHTFSAVVLTAILVQGSALAKPVAEKGWLGINIMSVTDETAVDKDLSTQSGVYVVQVFDASPSEQAGVKAGDVIVSLEGEEVSAVEDFVAELSTHKPGETIELGIVRGGEKHKLTVTLGHAPARDLMLDSELARKLARDERALRLKEKDLAAAAEKQHAAREQLRQTLENHRLQLDRDQMARLNESLRNLEPMTIQTPTIEPMTFAFNSGGFLGVYPVTADENLIKKLSLSVESGAYVNSVVQGGPADEAGIEDGDVIVLIDGEQITDEQGLRHTLAEHQPGDVVEVVVVRGEEKKEFEVELGGQSPARAFTWNSADDERLQLFPHSSVTVFPERKGMLGITISDVEGGEGVKVTGFTDDSAAMEGGMLEGDIILSVEGLKTPDVETLLKAMEGRKPGEEVRVKLLRDGKTRALAIELGRGPAWPVLGGTWPIVEPGGTAKPDLFTGRAGHEGEGENKNVIVVMIGPDGEARVVDSDKLEREGYVVTSSSDDQDGRKTELIKIIKDDDGEEARIVISVVGPDGEVKVVTPEVLKDRAAKATVMTNVYRSADAGTATGIGRAGTWTVTSEPKGWMGIMVDENSMELAGEKDLTLNYGIYVTGVVDGSPADKAGVRTGDVIIQAGDVEPQSLREFVEASRQVQSGSELFLKVVRGKNRIKLNVLRP